jgi:hypothetical protein
MARITPIERSALQGLAFIVKALNAAHGEQLRELVELWQKSGPNTAKLFGENPQLWIESQKAWKPVFTPSRTGAANINFVSNIGADGVMEKLGPAGERFKAVVLLNSLLVNPLWTKLAGPCARCDKFYIKKRTSQKVYCSRKCGNAATAVECSRQRIAAERKDKLKRAKVALTEWRNSKAQQDWKSWVAQRTGIDLRFLTRAVNKGEIQSPMKGR